jgi:hypothetical protein
MRGLTKLIDDAAGPAGAAALAEWRARLAPDAEAGRRSANPIDRRLGVACEFLALAKALEAQGADDGRIREVSTAVAAELVRPKTALQAWLKRLPVKLMQTGLMGPIARRLQRRAAIRGLPDGFVARIILDPAETYGLGWGVDILSCGICGLYKRHGAERFVPILCEVDRLTTALAGLDMVRTGTIATGAPCCDFRYKLASPPTH